MAGETIYQRIDQALEKARWRNLKLRGLYLDPTDYKAFARAETVRWQAASGSKAKLWPLSYESVLIIGRKLLPVNAGKSSAIYATSGAAIAIPKRLSVKVRLAA